jgi:hypothetical protein
MCMSTSFMLFLEFFLQTKLSKTVTSNDLKYLIQIFFLEMSLLKKPSRLANLWELESSDEESSTQDDVQSSRHSFPREEYERIKDKTRQGCLCDDCERGTVVMFEEDLEDS